MNAIDIANIKFVCKSGGSPNEPCVKIIAMKIFLGLKIHSTLGWKEKKNTLKFHLHIQWTSFKQRRSSLQNRVRQIQRHQWFIKHAKITLTKSIISMMAGKWIVSRWVIIERYQFLPPQRKTWNLRVPKW